MTKLCIDLCSGLGGMSQAFVNAGWEVVTVDNEPKFKPTLCTNILSTCKQEIQCFCKEELSSYEKIVIVASPPCERFSFGNRMFPKKGVRKALEIVGAVFELIAEIRPHYWIVENPKGRLRWFIGNPTSSVNLSDYGYIYKKPTDLWHNLAFPLIDSEKPYDKTWLRRNPTVRALMPLGLSEAILKAVGE